MARGSALENVMQALAGRGVRVARSGSGYVTQCPAHEDRRASLSFGQGEKGVVLNCHAGCSTEAVRVELNLPWPALFDGDDAVDNRRARPRADLWMPCQGHKENPCGGHKAAEYRYTDESGRLLYAVARCSRKGDGCPAPFAQWRPDESKKFGKAWGLPADVRRVLYDLPRVLEAAGAGRRVWILEGEKDVERMKVDFPDEVATTAMSGAGKSKWRKEYTRCLAGAAEVIIVADCDLPGLNFAEEVYRHVGGVVERVRVVCSPLLTDGADFSDHRDYGFGLDDFEPVAFEAIPRRPRMVIEVCAEDRTDPITFRGFSQEAVERSLLGAMLRFGCTLEVAASDIVTDERLAIAAQAASRLAHRGASVTPETVAAEIEEMGNGSYDRARTFLAGLEKVAFSDLAKMRTAVEILRKRAIRRELDFLFQATRNRLTDERYEIEEILATLRRMLEQKAEEIVRLGAYVAPVGDVFGDVVEEVKQEGARALRPAPADREIEEALNGVRGVGATGDGIAGADAGDPAGDRRVRGGANVAVLRGGSGAARAGRAGLGVVSGAG